jgi:hypothetical protein
VLSARRSRAPPGISSAGLTRRRGSHPGLLPRLRCVSVGVASRRSPSRIPLADRSVASLADLGAATPPQPLRFQVAFSLAGLLATSVPPSAVPVNAPSPQASASVRARRGRCAIPWQVESPMKVDASSPRRLGRRRTREAGQRSRGGQPSDETWQGLGGGPWLGFGSGGWKRLRGVDACLLEPGGEQAQALVPLVGVLFPRRKSSGGRVWLDFVFRQKAPEFRGPMSEKGECRLLLILRRGQDKNKGGGLGFSCGAARVCVPARGCGPLVRRA